MSDFWSPAVHALSPYVAGEQPQRDDLVKLNTNESPFAPSPAVASALQAFDVEQLRLYPDPDSTQLKQCIAAYHGLQAEQVFVGNGSDEVLAHTFYAFFQQQKPLLFPDITYSFYPVYCRLYNIAFEKVALDQNYRINLDAYAADNGGIIFANPNAPTGILLSLDELASLLQRNRNSVVVVDEAYIDFAPSESSALSLLASYPNLLVIRTLSKSRSLAGLRLGYALGSEQLIQGLQRVKDSFNSYPIDRLASELVCASFNDEAYFQRCVMALIEQRESLLAELAERGMATLPSAANFFMLHFPDGRAQEVFLALREKGVIVRYFDKPRLQDYLRITVGSKEQNRALLNALDDVTGG